MEVEITFPLKPQPLSKAELKDLDRFLKSNMGEKRPLVSWFSGYQMIVKAEEEGF